MERKVLIIRKTNNNLLASILNWLNRERICYEVDTQFTGISKEITNLICIDEENNEEWDFLEKVHIPIIFISRKRQIFENSIENINYIITDLIQDRQKYTEVKQEYLFKKGIYQVLIQKLSELVENKNHYNRIIYDITEIKKEPNNWIFNFDSISETYEWLSRKNKSLSNDFPRKGINFYNDKVYDDSSREINFLTEKIQEIKEKRRSIDIFICKKEELNILKNNYFFKALLKNISTTYSIYFIDKELLERKEKELLPKLLDGVVIYDDCIYRDTYDSEFSLGFVDCNRETIDLYNQYFDYLIEKYGYKLEKGEDIDEF